MILFNTFEKEEIVPLHKQIKEDILYRIIRYNTDNISYLYINHDRTYRS